MSVEYLTGQVNELIRRLDAYRAVVGYTVPAVEKAIKDCDEAPNGLLKFRARELRQYLNIIKDDVQ